MAWLSLGQALNVSWLYLAETPSNVGDEKGDKEKIASEKLHKI